LRGGATAARHTRAIADNVAVTLALELFAAAQAIDFRRARTDNHPQLGRGTAPVYALIRERVPFIEHDETMYPHIEALKGLMVSGQAWSAAQRAIG
jgi:histidine ammonia-lyase